jgi:hypothetical protein
MHRKSIGTEPVGSGIFDLMARVYCFTLGQEIPFTVFKAYGYVHCRSRSPISRSHPRNVRVCRRGSDGPRRLAWLVSR